MKLQIFTLVWFAGLAAATQVRVFSHGQSQLVESGGSSYALSSPLLSRAGWSTVSVNGQNVLAVAPNCMVTQKALGQLNSAEQAALNQARANLGPANVQSYGRVDSNSDGSYVHQSSSSSSSSSSYSSSYSSQNGVQTSQQSANQFTYSRPGLPNNLARVSVNNDAVSFIYLDDQILMKPLNCLDSSERELVRNLQAEATQTSRQMAQNMQHQFQSGMHHFQDNMNQMQADMADGMSEMFGNLFNFQRQAYQPPYVGMAPFGYNFFSQGSPFWRRR